MGYTTASGPGRRCLLGTLALALAGAAWASPPAGAASLGEPTNLDWVSARNLLPGAPSEFSSVDPCPDTRPDGSPITGSRIVRLTVTLPKGAGGFPAWFPAAADGSWHAAWSLDVAGLAVPHGRVTVEAECWDAAPFSLAVIGRYRLHGIRLGT
jgi:hypothetical protein